MKLSTLSTDNGLDVLCEIVPYIESIIRDDALKSELRRKINLPSDRTPAEVYAAALDKLSALIPIILKTHRDDVYGVVAAINDKNIEDIKRQPFLKTAADIRDVLNDKELIDFFKFSRDTENR